MSNATIIFLLTLCIMILICIIVYQQFVFHNGTKAKIHEISNKLKELLDTDSDEKVTVFTDNIGGLKWHPKRCYLTFPTTLKLP